MKRRMLLVGWTLVITTLVLSTTGCRYAANRYYDFRDIFALGAGVTAANPDDPVVPGSYGVLLEATDWIKLGYIAHNGYTAEMDQRGSFIGPEAKVHAGYLWWTLIYKNQDYDNAWYHNIFKDKDALWCKRMESDAMSSHGRPAKRLHYEHWSLTKHKGTGLLHRGWQYFEYTGVQAAISDPFLTHAGIMLRVGLDPSEVFDFVLGLFTIDLWHDDMTHEEFTVKYVPEPTPIPTPEPRAEPAPAQRDMPVMDTPEPMPTPIPTPVPMQPEQRDLPMVESLEPIPEMLIIYFDFDRFGIRPDQQANLDLNLKHLLENPDKRVVIEGHCDDRGTLEYNYALGQKRAQIVYDYFVANGIDPGRLRTVSKGEEEPADLSDTPEAHARNRRVEFKQVVLIRVE